MSESNQGTYEFDAIVVGSGMSGGWVAKELCERGLRVCVIERGHDLEPSSDYTDFDEPWEREHLGLVSDAERKVYPVQSKCYAFKNNTKHLWVKDAEHPYESHDDQPFLWFRGHHKGGKSIMWGRQAYRMSEIDFAANAKDGHGVDWPIRYADIAPWYSRVERFAGIAGTRENLEILPDGEFQPPFGLTCVEEAFRERLTKAFPKRTAIPSRIANLTAPTEEQVALGRGRCQVRDHCHRGCLFGGYFSANSATLPAAERTGNMTLLTDTTVLRVLYSEESKRAVGVETVNTRTGEASTRTARLIFLNAGTIPTAQILLNSGTAAMPRGLANRSDQVGRNLGDHVYGASMTALMPGFDNAGYRGRRPGGFYIPRYRNHLEEGNGYLRGFAFQGNIKRMNWQDHAHGPGVGTKLRNNLAKPGPWVVWMMAFAEALPNQKNSVSLHKSKSDRWGMPIPVIQAAWTENERALMQQAASDAHEILTAAGCQEIRGPKPEEVTLSAPGEAIHECGTARMGRDPQTSVLNGWNQSHDVANLFITDGSFMASTGCQNPSLTYMAFSARAAHYAADQVRDGVL